MNPASKLFRVCGICAFLFLIEGYRICFGVVLYLIGILFNLACLWGLAEEVWCTI